ELLCLIEGGDRVLYIPVALQKRHRGSILSAQQANDSQVQRPLNRRQPGLKFPKMRAKKFRSLVLQVRIRELIHQYEQQFRVHSRGDAVYGLQVLQVRVAQLRGGPVSAPKNEKSHNDQEQNTEQYSDSKESTSFHKGLLCCAKPRGRYRDRARGSANRLQLARRQSDPRGRNQP